MTRADGQPRYPQDALWEFERKKTPGSWSFVFDLKQLPVVAPAFVLPISCCSHERSPHFSSRAGVQPGMERGCGERSREGGKCCGLWKMGKKWEKTKTKMCLVISCV